jgi:hypothetical protein
MRILTDEPNPYVRRPNSDIRKIKTVQFIYIIKKVGLINQTPTIDIRFHFIHGNWGQAPFSLKSGLDKSSPYGRITHLQLFGGSTNLKLPKFDSPS